LRESSELSLLVAFNYRNNSMIVFMFIFTRAYDLSIVFEPSALWRVHDYLDSFLRTLHSIEVASKNHRVCADPQLAMRQKKEVDAKVADRAERLRDVLLEGLAVDQRHVDKGFEEVWSLTVVLFMNMDFDRKRAEKDIREMYGGRLRTATLGSATWTRFYGPLAVLSNSLNTPASVALHL
jgi:hypothetical protein